MVETNIPEIDDFEFFTFITGLEDKEQSLLKNLLNSFPYSKTHKLNVIDKSRYVFEKFKNNEKIYYSERHFIIKKYLNFQFDKWKEFCKSQEDKINIIFEEKFTSHVESMQNIIYKFSKKKFIIIIDSDLTFKNDQILKDIQHVLKIYKNEINEIGAIGQIYQEIPFSFPLKKKFSHEFYKIFHNDERINIIKIIKNIISKIFFNKVNKSNRIHKLPRIWTSCIAINKDLFQKENIIAKNLWLEVFDKTKTKSFVSHRVMGDSGASFLFGIALAGKKIINISMDKYVDHKRSGSREKSKDQVVQNWLSFDF